MNMSEFRTLRVGDIVQHTGVGVRRIVEVETSWDYTTGIPERVTFAITVEGGNRMKEGDIYDLPRLHLVSRRGER